MKPLTFLTYVSDYFIDNVFDCFDLLFIASIE